MQIWGIKAGVKPKAKPVLYMFHVKLIHAQEILSTLRKYLIMYDILHNLTIWATRIGGRGDASPEEMTSALLFLFTADD